MAKSLIFRCAGSDEAGATEDGSLAMVGLIEVSGQKMKLLCPPEGVWELVNRLQSAADLAITRRSATKHVLGEYQAELGVAVTEFKALPSDDANSIVLVLTAGKAKGAFVVPRSESPKLRAAIEAAEKEADTKKRMITN